MKIRTLIVDDEPLGRERIRNLLARDSEIEIAGECSDGPSAVTAIQSLKPDLVFLDIQMPEMDGFAVLEAIAETEVPIPATIFVTAYDTYALRAFEVHALDYLLKSFDRERFDAALQRAKQQIRRGRSELINDKLAGLLAELHARDSRPSRLAIRASGRVYFLRLDEIDWIEAADNYVRIHSGRDCHLVRESLQSLEVRLDAAKFLRIHRSTVVNLDRIRELQPLFHGDYLVKLEDGTELTLSRNYREKLAVPLRRLL